MQPWSRKRIEAVCLATLSFLTVIPFRFYGESQTSLYTEIALIAILCVALVHGIPKRFTPIVACVVPAVSILFSIISRWLASPIAFELTAMTTFGAAALAMAITGNSDRWRAMSLVMSGFLILFCAAISDTHSAVALPIIWMLGCVWHLVANRWEWLDLAMPETVSRNWKMRPASVAVTLLVLSGCAYVAKDRIKDSGWLGIGIMPTSGGSKWSDPAARSGVGTGDAAIAAKDHAESFGAVDSDIFLESTEPSLFDMANDLIGEPKVKKKWEPKQALANEKVITTHERASKTEQGGSSFSTDRLPPNKHQHFADAKENSVVQWDGPTGIRLAMQRHDTFDGVDWTQEGDESDDALARSVIDGNAWFFDSSLRRYTGEQPDNVSVGLLKVIRLDSTRIPAPMMTVGVHIKAVDRADFYAIDRDGSYYMPRRDKVPALTVVHLASLRISEDELIDGCRARSPFAPVLADSLLDKTFAAITADQESRYDKLRAVVTHLRTQFVFDRGYAQEYGSPVERFLESRRGGDHLFATTAALMARKIGFESRLVKGFYVRPDSFDFASGHASVAPSDFHVWAEVKLNDGRWFEIEPTPGYAQPQYRPSLWLSCRRFAAAYWPFGLGIFTFALAGFLLRRIWIDWLCSLAWALGGWLSPRPKLALAMRIIEVRAGLAKQRRPDGCPQRDWMEQLTQGDRTLSEAAGYFCDAADKIFFGSGDERFDEPSTRVVNMLNTKTISQLTMKDTACTT